MLRVCELSLAASHPSHPRQATRKLARLRDEAALQQLVDGKLLAEHLKSEHKLEMNERRKRNEIK
jgi:hypothetical protein